MLPLRQPQFVAMSALLASLVGAAFACCSEADADDWTFREFPGQRVPSPEELNRLLSGLAAETTLSDRSAEVIRALGPEMSESLPQQAPLLSPEQRQLLEQLLKESGVSISEWMGSRGSAANRPSRRLPADVSRSVPTVGPDRLPSHAGSGDRGMSSRLPNDGIDSRRALELLNRSAAGGLPSGDGREGSTLLDRKELVRRAELLGGEFTGIKRRGPIQSESRPTAIARPKPGSRSESWQRALGGEWNRVLLGAAQRATEMGSSADDSSEDSSAGKPLSEASLDRVVSFARKWMEEQPAGREPPMSRTPHEVRHSNPESSRGFPWNVRWPEVQTAALSPASTSPAGPVVLPPGGEPLWLLAICSCLGLTLLLAVRARRRALRKDGSRREAVSLGGIESGKELVQAVDRLLMARYGADASWWNCRAVARALINLRPDRRVAMSRLATYYRRARYAPPLRQLTGAQLKHSARMLQQLAEPLNLMPEGVRSLHTAA